MEFPASAIFAFNANIDYVAKPSKSQMQRLKNELPTLFQQISECFSMDGQMEVKISKQECKILLSIFRPSRKIVGGQAGNAAQQASALGINCFLHSNFASRETLLLFDHPEKIFFAKNGRFFPAAKFESNMPSAYHFVIQSQHLSSRFIASFDPSPIRLDKGFSKAIAQIACSVPKAFVGGFHLLSNPHQISLLSSEMRRWKKANPKMKIF
ncbi:MAG: hypothetical protein QW275_03230, partial [Candidatus Anstonellaceae archaeon]